MPKEYFLKYGGVKFTNKASPEEINRFVMNLPENKRSSMYEIAKELSDHGLIEIKPGEFSSADDEMVPFQE